jgi:hypothetical protein
MSVQSEDADPAERKSLRAADLGKTRPFNFDLFAQEMVKYRQSSGFDAAHPPEKRYNWWCEESAVWTTLPYRRQLGKCSKRFMYMK